MQVLDANEDKLSSPEEKNTLQTDNETLVRFQVDSRKLICFQMTSSTTFDTELEVSWRFENVLYGFSLLGIADAKISLRF